MTVPLLIINVYVNSINQHSNLTSALQNMEQEKEKNYKTKPP